MRAPLLAGLLALAGCGREPAPEAAKPAAAPAPEAAAPAAASGPSALIVNDAGAEVRDVYVSCPGGPFRSSAPSLQASARLAVALPQDCSRVSVMFTRKPDLQSEKTADRLGDTVTFTLQADGGVTASLGDVFQK